MSARFAATLIRSSTCRRSSTAASRSSSTLQVCSAPRRHSHARIRRVESVLPRPLPGSARACGADARGSRSTSPRVGRQQAVRHHPGRRGGSSAPGRVEQRGRPWPGSDQRWADPALRTTSSWVIGRRSGSRRAATRRLWPRAATGTTSNGDHALRSCWVRHTDALEPGQAKGPVAPTGCGSRTQLRRCTATLYSVTVSPWRWATRHAPSSRRYTWVVRKV
jgi:hypothetical protein